MAATLNGWYADLAFSLGVVALWPMHLITRYGVYTNLWYVRPVCQEPYAIQPVCGGQFPTSRRCLVSLTHCLAGCPFGRSMPSLWSSQKPALSMVPFTPTATQLPGAPTVWCQSCVWYAVFLGYTSRMAVSVKLLGSFRPSQLIPREGHVSHLSYLLYAHP